MTPSVHHAEAPESPYAWSCLLDDAAAGMLGQLLDESPDPDWSFTETGANSAHDGQADSRLGLSNGYIGLRGDFTTPPQRDAAYVAGYFQPGAGPAGVPALRAAPRPFPLTISVDGAEVAPATVTSKRTRSLDLRNGFLRSRVTMELPSGKSVLVEALRFTSLADRCLALQVIRLRPTSAALVRIDVSASQAESAPATEAGPRPRGRALAHARRAAVVVDGAAQPLHSEWEGIVQRELLVLQLAVYALAPDRRSAQQRLRQALTATLEAGIAGAIARHKAAWQERWRFAGLQLEGDAAMQQALRFAIHHLIAAADPGSDSTSIGARGLTGDAYLGHVFWDAEIFLQPFFDACWPQAARAMLMYRYNTLDAARRKAAARGYRGALYAWESADTGDEATPAYAFTPDGKIVLIKSGEQEHHISADVAYGVWRYWLATADADFLRLYGAEIILETARFWASRAQNGNDGRYHIRGVIGPDEYHDDVDDNAFTNGMARWNLRTALRVVELLRRSWPEDWSRLQQSLRLDDAELRQWQRVADGLVLLQDNVSGVIEQFEGYFQLEDIDLAAYADRNVPMDVLLGPERIAASRISKQADVLMLMALLPEEFSDERLRVNFDYYEPRCGHGSSLSAPIHALVAARLGKVDKALDYLHRTAAIDLTDSFRNTAGGLHMAALAGMWQAVVHGFAGLRLEEDGIRLRPHLPPVWRLLQFRVQWHGRELEVTLTHERAQLRVLAGEPLRADIDGYEGVASREQPLERVYGS